MKNRGNESMVTQEEIMKNLTDKIKVNSTTINFENK